MNKKEAEEIISSTFSNNFDEQRYEKFASNLFKTYESKDKIVESQYIKLAYRAFVIKYKIVGTFEDREGHEIDILEVNLKKSSTLERARTAQRNFIAEYLKSRNKDAALVAFISPDNKEWRLSLVKMENSLEVVNEKLKTKEEVTPAKRWSFLVGKNEGSHTARSRFINILTSDEDPNLAEIEAAFDIETVTKEFFDKYTELYFRFKEYLDFLIAKDETIKKDFEEKEISTVDFAKKTLGQIVFLYFLQKKGWFGVAPDKQWGEGPKRFLREVFERRKKYGDNFFNDILEPLFYKALAQDRGIESIYPDLNNCRMPFLNGGLFEPMNGYLWETTNIIIPDELFSNDHQDKKTGDIGDGILDVFDRYNFTVNENEPLEKEVAVDPEMLGKVFENLLDIKDRKSKGAFYTPREIVHYMCQESLINYLCTEINNEISRNDLELFIRKGDRIIENDTIALTRQEANIKKHGREYNDTTYSLLLPASVRTRAEKLDSLLKNIKVADPAVGSGAFPLGMINEIVRARKVLNVYLKSDISDYELKKHAITHSIYGVDIDPGAVEIAKLRLWLSLVVDEETPHPLPNLEYKIMQGNSLISEYEGIKLFDEGIFDKEKKQKAEQLALGIGKTRSDLKMELLQKRIASFINESQRTKKQNLKKEIDVLKWELIEETLKEQRREDKLEEIRKLRRKNIRPFFIWKLEFSDVFKEKGGFDVVIGNPPYKFLSGKGSPVKTLERKGKIKEAEELKKELNFIAKKYKNSSLGCRDYYKWFIELGTSLLRLNGVYSYITPNTYLSLSNYKDLRKIIFEKLQCQKIIDLGFDIFDQPVVPSAIFIANKNNVESEIIEIYYSDLKVFTNNDLKKYGVDALWKEHYLKVKYYNGKLLLYKHAIAEKIYLSISSTLKDFVFISEGEHSLNNDFSKEFKAGLPVIFDKNVYRYKIAEKKYLPESYCVKYSKTLHSGERFFIRKTGDHILAVPYLDVNLAVIHQNFYVVKPKESNISLFLVALLSSRFLSFLYQNGVYGQKGRTLAQFRIYGLYELPLPLASQKKKDRIVKIFNQIIEITSAYDYDSKNPPMKQKELENQIDDFVYKLYDLTEEEIEIVENFSKK